MKSTIAIAAELFAAAAVVGAAEFHVAVNGTDGNSGTRKAPLRTIQQQHPGCPVQTSSRMKFRRNLAQFVHGPLVRSTDGSGRLPRIGMR